MSQLSTNLHAAIFAAACMLISTYAYAAEVDVKMLNKGSDGSVMAFEPALVHVAVGDSVHFIATDKGHNAESIANMVPDGAQPFSGKMNEELVVKLDKPGVYGYRCKPHYGMGMVGLIVVGNPVNEDAAKSAINSMPNFPKTKFTKLFGEIDTK
jgi:pseudoazurin